MRSSFLVCFPAYARHLLLLSCWSHYLWNLFLMGLKMTRISFLSRWSSRLFSLNLSLWYDEEDYGYPAWSMILCSGVVLQFFWGKVDRVSTGIQERWPQDFERPKSKSKTCRNLYDTVMVKTCALLVSSYSNNKFLYKSRRTVSDNIVQNIPLKS